MKMFEKQENNTNPTQKALHSDEKLVLAERSPPEVTLFTQRLKAMLEFRYTEQDFDTCNSIRPDLYIPYRLQELLHEIKDLSYIQRRSIKRLIADWRPNQSAVKGKCLTININLLKCDTSERGVLGQLISAYGTDFFDASELILNLSNSSTNGLSPPDGEMIAKYLAVLLSLSLIEKCLIDSKFWINKKIISLHMVANLFCREFKLNRGIVDFREIDSYDQNGGDIEEAMSAKLLSLNCEKKEEFMRFEPKWVDLFYHSDINAYEIWYIAKKNSLHSDLFDITRELKNCDSAKSLENCLEKLNSLYENVKWDTRGVNYQGHLHQIWRNAVERMSKQYPERLKIRHIKSYFFSVFTIAAYLSSDHHARSPFYFANGVSIDQYFSDESICSGLSNVFKVIKKVFRRDVSHLLSSIRDFEFLIDSNNECLFPHGTEWERILVNWLYLEVVSEPSVYLSYLVSMKKLAWSGNFRIMHEKLLAYLAEKDYFTLNKVNNEFIPFVLGGVASDLAKEILTQIFVFYFIKTKDRVADYFYLFRELIQFYDQIGMKEIIEENIGDMAAIEPEDCTSYVFFSYVAVYQTLRLVVNSPDLSSLRDREHDPIISGSDRYRQFRIGYFEDYFNALIKEFSKTRELRLAYDVLNAYLYARQASMSEKIDRGVIRNFVLIALSSMFEFYENKDFLSSDYTWDDCQRDVTLIIDLVPEFLSNKEMLDAYLRFNKMDLDFSKHVLNCIFANLIDGKRKSENIDEYRERITIVIILIEEYSLPCHTWWFYLILIGKSKGNHAYFIQYVESNPELYRRVLFHVYRTIKGLVPTAKKTAIKLLLKLLIFCEEVISEKLDCTSEVMEYLIGIRDIMTLNEIEYVIDNMSRGTIKKITSQCSDFFLVCVRESGRREYISDVVEKLVKLFIKNKQCDILVNLSSDKAIVSEVGFNSILLYILNSSSIDDEDSQDLISSDLEFYFIDDAPLEKRISMFYSDPDKDPTVFAVIDRLDENIKSFFEERAEETRSLWREGWGI